MKPSRNVPPRKWTAGIALANGVNDAPAYEGVNPKGGDDTRVDRPGRPQCGAGPGNLAVMIGGKGMVGGSRRCPALAAT